LLTGGISRPHDEMFHLIGINGMKEHALLDTGSPCSFLNFSFFQKLSLNLIPCLQSFFTVSGEEFKTHGKCFVNVDFAGNNKRIMFYVVNSPIKVILGIDALKILNVSLQFSSQKDAVLHTVVNSVSVKQDEFFDKFKLPLNISNENLVHLKSLLWEFKDIFSLSEYDIGQTHKVKHSIHTKECKPTYSKQFRLPFSQKQEIQRMTNEMLDNGIIEECSSPWSSPAMLVKKKDGSSRFVIDYRKLNDATEKDRMPIPNIDDLLDNFINDLLDNLSGSSIFFSIDLAGPTR